MEKSLGKGIWVLVRVEKGLTVGVGVYSDIQTARKEKASVEPNLRPEEDDLQIFGPYDMDTNHTIDYRIFV